MENPNRTLLSWIWHIGTKILPLRKINNTAMESQQATKAEEQPIHMTSSEFQKHQQKAFELVKSGQPVAVSYQGEIFDIVRREHNASPANEKFLEKIRRAESQVAAGQYTLFKTHEELQDWFDAQE